MSTDFFIIFTSFFYPKIITDYIYNNKQNPKDYFIF